MPNFLKLGEESKLDPSIQEFISCRSWKHDGGYVLAYRNGSNDRMFKVNMKWQLNNASITVEGEPSGPQFTLNVGPKMTQLVSVSPAEVGESWGYSVSRQYSVRRVSNDQAGRRPPRRAPRPSAPARPQPSALPASRPSGSLREETRAQGKERVYTPGLTSKTLQFGQGVAMLYENNTSDTQLEEELTFNMKNLQLVGGKRGQTQRAVNVPPGEEVLVVVKMVKEGEGFSFGVSSKALLRPV